MAVMRRGQLITSTDDIRSFHADVRSAAELAALAQEHGIRITPLDIVNLVKSFGIYIIQEPMDPSISGYLEKNGDVWVIGVNPMHHPRRQIFTLAHELAHYVLHRKSAEKFIDKTFFRGIESSKYEREADVFAAQLLMPSVKFKELAESGVSLKGLSQYFQTSLISVEIRAKELGLIELV